MTDKLDSSERKCLEALDSRYGTDGNCICFAVTASYGELSLTQVRRAVRKLARKGFAEFHRGLFNEDGAPYGSGYCLTAAGHAIAESFEEVG